MIFNFSYPQKFHGAGSLVVRVSVGFKIGALKVVMEEGLRQITCPHPGDEESGWID